MSILPFARGSFENMKHDTPKNGVVTIMLTKRIFGVKNMWLIFFMWLVAASILVGQNRTFMYNGYIRLL